MKSTIDIAMDNAAFDSLPGLEVARILRAIVERIESRGLTSFPLRDVNGNKVGSFEIDNTEKSLSGIKHTLDKIAQLIRDFHVATDEDQHTDSDEAWDVLHQIHDLAADESIENWIQSQQDADQS